MLRQNIACPTYYPQTFSDVDKIIKNAFLHKEGPGTLPTTRRQTPTKLIIAPCGKYDHIGPCAAWAYQDIAEAKFPETYIIIGSNNQSNTKISTYLFANWETPLGEVRVNEELGKELINLYPKIINEHTAHEHEHSVELQLPFLQFATRDKLHDLNFIPLAINTTNPQEIKELATKLVEFTKDKNITIIASSTIEDTPTIQYINNLNSEGLLNYKQRKEKSTKMILPALVVMEIAKQKKLQTTMINMQSAFKTTGNKNDAEYYAAIKFK